MKVLLFIIMMAFGYNSYGQTDTAKIKSARDYIIENENKRPTPPNIVKPDPKKLKPLDEKPASAKKEKQKKCCLFCKKKK